MRVVFLHASGLTGRQWHRWLPLFPGAIAPERTEAEPGHSQLAHDLATVRETLAVYGPAHLVGHSYGGVLALQTALDVPALVRSVTVYEPPLTALLATGTPEDRALLEGSLHDSLLDAQLAGSPTWLAAFVDWWNGPGAFAALPESSRQELLRTAPRAAREVLSLASDDRTLEDYQALSCPVLVMRGSQPPTPIARVLALLGSLPAASSVTVDNAGHMAPLVATARVAPLVADFLRDRAGEEPA